MARRIGITSTVPVEIILAAGDVPVDLNNVFINDPDPLRFVRFAEKAGYPHNVCGWIKGLFGVVVETRCVDIVIALTEGDCSSTLALVETLMINDVPVIPFGYPFDRDRDVLQVQMKRLAAKLDTSLADAQDWVSKLRPLREKLRLIDTLTWREDLVSGNENHTFLVSASDFCGDPHSFEQRVDRFLETVRSRPVLGADVRLGYIGVPPIWSDLYEFLESQGARVVFNEMQRQFSMPTAIENIVEQYRAYTYPYGAFVRMEDIRSAVQERGIHGIVHYTQSFCFRQIEDLIFRKEIPVPILTIEADQPSPLDGRTRLRIGAFIEMLRKNKDSLHRAHAGVGKKISFNRGKDS